MRRTRRVSAAVLLAVVLAVAGGCGDGGGGDDDTDAGGTGSEQSGSDRSAPGSEVGAAAGAVASGADGAGGAASGGTGSTGTSTAITSPTTTAPAGCVGPGTEVPTAGGASSADVVDVDGDGQGDRAWFSLGPSGAPEVGIATAAGGGDVVTSSLGVGSLSLVVADADGRGPIELVLADGRTAELWAFAGCALQPVIGPDDRPFLFDLGVRGNGTGVGCVDVGGRAALVGLDVTEDDGTTVRWRRTVIELDGLTATIGESETGTFDRPGDEHAIGLLHTVSCGDAVAEDGRVTSP